MANFFTYLLTLTLAGSVLALALLALRYIFYRKIPSSFYYYAWLIVLLRFVLFTPGLIPAAAPISAPIAEFTGEYTYVSQAPSTQGSGMPVLPDSQNMETAAAPAALNSPAQLPAARAEAPETSRLLRSPYLWIGVWLTGTIAAFAFYAVGYFRFAVSLRSLLATPSDRDKAVYDSIPGKKPPLYRCDGVASPMLIGGLPPMVLLPKGDFDETTLHNVLRHELMHYRRRDLFYKWFAVLVYSIQWFNPIIYFVRREINHSCELSCDEMLIRSMTREERQSYGETLLHLAANRILPEGVVATGFATEKRNLKERLTQIMRYKLSLRSTVCAIVIIAVLACCAIVIGPRIAKVGDSIPEEVLDLPPQAAKPNSEEANSDETAPAPINYGKTGKVVNILLIGQDSIPEADSKRADTIMLCTINKETKALTMTSFQRDLYVELPDYMGHRAIRGNRINTVYSLGNAFGGEKGAMEMMNLCLYENFGVEIDATVELNFDAFIAVIDSLGGLDVSLSESEAQYMNQLGSIDRSFNEGSMHLNGLEALVYARMRSDDSNGDFGRTQRQREVANLIHTQLKSMSLTRLDELLRKILPMVITDLDNDQLTTYARELLPLLKDLKFESARIPAENAYSTSLVDLYSDGTYFPVLVPDLQKNTELLSAIAGK